MPVTRAYLTMAVKFVSQKVYGDGVIRLRDVLRLEGLEMIEFLEWCQLFIPIYR